VLLRWRWLVVLGRGLTIGRRHARQKIRHRRGQGRGSTTKLIWLLVVLLVLAVLLVLRWLRLTVLLVLAIRLLCLAMVLAILLLLRWHAILLLGRALWFLCIRLLVVRRRALVLARRWGLRVLAIRRWLAILLRGRARWWRRLGRWILAILLRGLALVGSWARWVLAILRQWLRRLRLAALVLRGCLALRRRGLWPADRTFSAIVATSPRPGTRPFTAPTPAPAPSAAILAATAPAIALAGRRTGATRRPAAASRIIPAAT